MSLVSNNTKWVFILNKEDSKKGGSRHLFDIAFGLYCLEQVGVSPQNVELYIDGSESNIQQIISFICQNPYTIKKTIDVRHFAEESASYDDLVMFIFGHGTANEGITGRKKSLTARRLYSLLGHIRKPTRAVVYMGQCYSGLFRNMPAYDNPQLVVVGAVGNKSSFSILAEDLIGIAPKLQGFPNRDFPTIGDHLTYNVFLVCIFAWLLNPNDIDADGNMSVYDSFRYALDNVTHLLQPARAYYETQKRYTEAQLEQDPANPVLADKLDTFNEYIDCIDNPDSWISDEARAKSITVI